MKRILAVAVHPDDESLGCGGTLLRHKAGGDELHWLVATTLTEELGYSPRRIAEREEEMRAVASRYGFAAVHKLGLPTTRVDTIGLGEIAQAVSRVLEQVRPQVVYLPFRGDVHSDHRVMFDVLFSCLKSFRSPDVERILSMETVSETEFAPPCADTAFMPNCFVDVSEFFEKKIEILEEYKGEMAAHPFPRSEETLRALARFRGAQAGVAYAEAFMLLKEIIR